MTSRTNALTADPGSGTTPAPALRIGSAQPAVRLLVFHHAGGSAASYLRFLAVLPADAELVLFQLPGRGPQEKRLRARDFSEALTGFRAQAAGLFDRPAIVLGHSLGALFAHALVAGLHDAPRREVRALILSAAPAVLGRGTPAHLRPAAALLRRNAARLEKELREYGGCPPAVLADPRRLAETVELYGYDLHLTDTYPGAPDLVDVPQELWNGAEDPAFDGAASGGTASGGAAPHGATHRYSAASGTAPAGLVRRRDYPGGHFFLLEQEAPAADLAALLLRSRRETKSSIS